MSVSALGQFIYWLHNRAQQAGRIDINCEEATQLLDALSPTGLQSLARLRRQAEGLTEAQIAGLELRSGRLRSALSKKVRRAAVRRLRAPGLAVHAVDELGYTPVLVHGLLQNHFWELESAPLGSEAHLIYVDLSSAIAQATERTKVVAFLLIAGLGPQEIGTVLRTNGSRRIGKAMAELSRILERNNNGGRH